MTIQTHPQIYDSIGHGYSDQRVPDDRVASRILHALGDAQTVCNVGAGTGSYEPTDRTVTAVEPSQTMIMQRRNENRVICASAENLPFANNEFDASMAVLTIHHWPDVRAGLAEMRRVSRRQVIFTFDPDRVDSLWLVRDYLPEIIELDRKRAVPLHVIQETLQVVSIEPVKIPFDCTDGFQGAYWRRPQEYLKPEVRAAISTLAQLPQDIVSRGMNQLSQDLQSGHWHKRYSNLLDCESLDLGYRLVVADSIAN
jgi:SAM-dependent methyltransferase